MKCAVETRLEGQAVRGVASLDNCLYLLRENKSSEQIEVYDVDSFCLLRSLTVPGLGRAVDIVACGYNHCAYVSDTSLQSIHKLSLSGDNLTHWRVKERPAGLSLTVKHSLLVTCRYALKIKEFTTDGKLLREIVLPSTVRSPWHSIQLFSGALIVCHGFFKNEEPSHRVCLIASDGKLVKSYGGPGSSGSQQIYMPAPCHVAVDENEQVLVVDRNNDRILLLSATLTYLRIVMSREQLQWKPYRLCTDVQRRRLYVAVNDKWVAGKVIVSSL